MHWLVEFLIRKLTFFNTSLKPSIKTTLATSVCKQKIGLYDTTSPINRIFYGYPNNHKIYKTCNPNFKIRKNDFTHEKKFVGKYTIQKIEYSKVTNFDEFKNSGNVFLHFSGLNNISKAKSVYM